MQPLSQATPRRRALINTHGHSRLQGAGTPPVPVRFVAEPLHWPRPVRNMLLLRRLLSPVPRALVVATLLIAPAVGLRGTAAEHQARLSDDLVGHRARG